MAAIPGWAAEQEGADAAAPVAERQPVAAAEEEDGEGEGEEEEEEEEEL